MTEETVSPEEVSPEEISNSNEIPTEEFFDPSVFLSDETSNSSEISSKGTSDSSGDPSKDSSDSDNIPVDKQIFDLEQLFEIAKSLCSLLEYDKLLEAILYTSMCQVHSLGAGIFVLGDSAHKKFELGKFHTGLDVSKDIDYSFEVTHSFVKFLEQNPNAYTPMDLKTLYPNIEELDVINSLSPSLIISVHDKKDLRGILVLGERFDVGDGIVYSNYEKKYMLSIATLSGVCIANANLVKMSTTDVMTRLKLKHYFFGMLEDKIVEAQRNDSPLAVLMLDIDHFKIFNDTYGHACGDYVLIQVANIISESVRNHDLAARYGGEEFVVMLTNADAPSAMMVAERIRKNIEACDFVYDNQHMKVTISIGVAVLQHRKNITAAKLVEFADQALYISKNNGRNRSSFAPMK